MTASPFHRAPIVTGDLFSFQPDTGETWREETLFDQVTPQIHESASDDATRQARFEQLHGFDQ